MLCHALSVAVVDLPIGVVNFVSVNSFPSKGQMMALLDMQSVPGEEERRGGERAGDLLQHMGI